MIVRGALVILVAAFVWGIGNAVTGYTAHEYLTSRSLLPAVDIALANTLGGLVFLAIVFLLRAIHATSFKWSAHRINERSLAWRELVTPRTVFSSALKGMNTCLFVFSTTYIVATQSLVFESTYIVWSLLLSVMFLGRTFNWTLSVAMSAVLWVGVVLVSGGALWDIRSIQGGLGAAFGICAGLSYAGFLFTWSDVTGGLSNLRSQLMATSIMLLGSFLTIASVTAVVSFIGARRTWVPFANVSSSDALLQIVNGVFAVGVVYLLVTIGMHKLSGVQEGVGFVVALGLSFSIPFTLLPEFAIGKFVPTSVQLVGMILFMVGFVSISVHLSSRTPEP